MSDDDAAATTSPMQLTGPVRVRARRPDWLVLGAVVTAVVIVLALGALLWARSPVATANSAAQPTGTAAPTLASPPVPTRVVSTSSSAAVPASTRPLTRVNPPPAVPPPPQVAAPPRAAPAGTGAGGGSTSKPSNPGTTAGNPGGGTGNKGNGDNGNGGGGNGDLFPDGF